MGDNPLNDVLRATEPKVCLVSERDVYRLAEEMAVVAMQATDANGLRIGMASVATAGAAFDTLKGFLGAVLGARIELVGR